MTQYELTGTELLLKVKKSPLLPRGLMFFFSTLFFISPIVGVMLSISQGDGMQFGFFIGFIVSGLLGFYFLRIALWNTYGLEKIIFHEEAIHYEANYGWFVDGKKEVKRNAPLSFSIKPIGFVEDKLGLFTIAMGENMIETVTKMPIEQIEALIAKLEGIT